MIDIVSLSAGYKDFNVLHNINIQINKGEIIAIIGPNGCGKSTLLKCIAKQIKPTSGEVYLDDTLLENYTQRQLARRISYLKQTREIASISVEALVCHGRFPYMGFPRKLTDKDKSIAKNAMIKAGVFEIRHKELVSLSGGECQKAYIAMCLAQDSDVLLLDEPTTYLDIKHQLELLKLLGELKNEGKTIVTVLHDINSAISIADRLIIISNGHIDFFGEPTDLSAKDAIETAFDIQTKNLLIDGKPLMKFGI